MKRTTIFLEERLERDLHAVARREGRPMGAVVREAIARYIRLRQRSRGKTVSFLAMGRSGRTDTAERHEDLLWRDLTPHEPAEPAGGAPAIRRRRAGRPSARRRRA
jgi:predicted transcriptional regulator